MEGNIGTGKSVGIDLGPTYSGTDQEVGIYEFSVTVYCINLQVKFPCKMKLQFNNNDFTHKVSPVEEKMFIFNQEVTLSDEGDKPYYEIYANLTT